MFACCNLCYEKYLTSDKKVDEEALKESRKKFNVKSDDWNSIRKNLCMCECHVKGSNIIH